MLAFSGVLWGGGSTWKQNIWWMSNIDDSFSPVKKKYVCATAYKIISP